jgi:hypothetical protein
VTTTVRHNRRVSSRVHSTASTPHHTPCYQHRQKWRHRSRGHKRYTLAVRRVTHGDTASQVLAEFLGLVDNFDFYVKAVYVDREFYDGKCLTLMQAHNHAYVVPVVKWGTKLQTELSEGWSREIEHDLTTEFDGHEWTVERAT